MTKRSPDPFEALLLAIKTITGRPATGSDRRRFQQYLDLFVLWNRTHRMTGLRSSAAIVRELFIDSLLFLPLLPSRPLAMVDIGAGAGIPGLPLRLVDSKIALTLIESKRKRVSFLLAACREMDLRDVTVAEGRAEEIVEAQPELAGAFDVAVSRAVGPIGSLLPLALRFLRPGGLFLASGPPEGSTEPQVEAVRVRVPGTDGTRVFLRVKAQTHRGLPEGHETV